MLSAKLLAACTLLLLLQSARSKPLFPIEVEYRGKCEVKVWLSKDLLKLTIFSFAENEPRPPVPMSVTYVIDPMDIAAGGPVRVLVKRQYGGGSYGGLGGGGGPDGGGGNYGGLSGGSGGGDGTRGGGGCYGGLCGGGGGGSEENRS